MTNTDLITQNDLPFLFQLLEAESEVTDSLYGIQRQIQQVTHHKNSLNLEYHKQNHLIRNIIISLLVAFILASSTIMNYYLALFLLFGTLSYLEHRKKTKIKGEIEETESELNNLLNHKTSIQNELAEIKSNNSVYTNKIPEKFRDPYSIVQLFNLIHSGQADNLKEAYQALEKEYRHQEQMKALNKQTAALRENNAATYKMLNSIEELNATQREQLEELQYLSHSARNMSYNSQRTNDYLSQNNKHLENINRKLGD